jgi:hypothetical protein
MVRDFTQMVRNFTCMVRSFMFYVYVKALFVTLPIRLSLGGRRPPDIST